MSLQGMIEEMGLGEIIQALSLNRHKGTLRIETDEGISKFFYLSEGEIVLIRTVKSEPVRIGEAIGVAVHCAEEDVHHLAWRDIGSGDAGAVERDAVIDLHRRVVAQELFDRVLGQLWPVAQQCELIGMTEERYLGVAEKILRGLVAGLQQKDRVGDELSVGELLTIGLGKDER